VQPICARQLADWGIDYFDLYLIHFPVALEYVDPSVRDPPGWFADDAGTEIRPSKATIQETWTAMEALVLESGLARSIGVSNFQAQLLYDLLRYARIPPATLQVEHHPYLVQPQLLKAAQAQGITVTAYSSFGPAGFVELDMARAKQATPLMEEATITKVADKLGKTPAQVLLRWATQRGIAVIPKSSSEGRMKENLESSDFDIDAKDLEAISALDLNLRFNQPTNVSFSFFLLFGLQPSFCVMETDR
jgi:D-xylose reductase